MVSPAPPSNSTLSGTTTAARPLIASGPAHRIKPLGSRISAQIQQHRAASKQVSTLRGPPSPKGGPTQAASSTSGKRPSPTQPRSEVVTSIRR